MIHVLEIDENSEPVAVKKAFRKKLMTGGGVVRLKAGLSEDQLAHLVEVFSAGVVANGVQAMVLREVAKVSNLSSELRGRLQSLDLKEVSSEFGE